MAPIKVRTRFAPSPTGYMHVGNLRTALYAYLVAKAAGGNFILRIEDTDRARLVDNAVDIIYGTLRETGLLWDEGPDVGGPAGPYIQSQRMDIYKDYALKLVQSGGAYRCFCQKPDEGGFERADDPCRAIPASESESRANGGAAYIVRQKMPKEGTTRFSDAVYGDIEVENSQLEDQVLIKSDGMPTYNFANVVDDSLMGITHVIRGSEYLSSTPKYNLLYESFGWEPPIYIHCPPVMKNASEKLSKRNGDAAYSDLIATGHLGAAVLNYLALLGWSPKGEREIFSLAELTAEFDISGISKSPAIFDPKKLRHINSEYIKKMTPDEFHDAALPWILKGAARTDIDTKLLASLLHERCEILSDIPPQIDFIDKLPDYDISLFENKKMKTSPQTALEILEALLPVLTGQNDYSPDALRARLSEFVEVLGVKNGYVLWPLRIAAAGKAVTPGGGIEICAILGREETISRVRHAINKLSQGM